MSWTWGVITLAANNDWLLALDLSTPYGIVVLEGNGNLFHRNVAAGSRVSQLFVEVSELLSLAAINATGLGVIGVGKGPGSFTGIRVAVMAAKALAKVLEIPLVAPDTLEVIAAGCRGSVGAVMATLDARRGEVYYGLYRLGRAETAIIEEPRVGPPREAVDHLSQWKGRLEGDIGLTGSALKAFPEAWPPDLLVFENGSPSPEGLSRVCRKYHERRAVEDPMKLRPLYLRRPDARESFCS